MGCWDTHCDRVLTSQCLRVLAETSESQAPPTSTNRPTASEMALPVSAEGGIYPPAGALADRPTFPEALSIGSQAEPRAV